ncbi:MAG: VWA domain-containing protein [Brevinematales bacterium]|jgi:Ca-activated chloride channel family protein
MEKTIGKILKELYSIDPGLRDREDELKRVIGELMANKPEIVMNKAFQRSLKKALLEKFSPGSKKTRFFRGWTFKAALGGAAVLCTALVALYIANPRISDLREVPKSIEDLSTSAVSGKPGYKAPSMPESKKAEGGIEKEAVDTEMATEDRLSPEKDIRAVREFNTEGYDRVEENDFMDAAKDPLSTFSIDVDTASYANVRRFITQGSLPYPDAVRIEEMINYFTYRYKEPEGDSPMAFNCELSSCPWNAGHELLRIGLQAKKVSLDAIPPNNLVFLIDVSGSMDEENKLPLVKSALKLLVKQMRSQDSIAIVVYAGNAGLVLPSTSCSLKEKILAAIDNLEAGGSTAGGEGILLAYKTAKQSFKPKGNNRVILATDGDFNVGASSDGELVRMIEEKRNDGIYLTILGFGMGNYKDSKMEKLADNGNGNYAYIDTLAEAEKVLVKEMSGTLLTLAKDVKIQIEFNPLSVREYRLIGYEKRLLKSRDFDDDKKDAGELGAGQSVTALYEIVPSTPGKAAGGDQLKYQTTSINTNTAGTGELMTIKFRYKKPDENKSLLLVYPVLNNKMKLSDTSPDFRFAAAVAEWGLILRNSKFKGSAAIDQVLETAGGALGTDEEGYRHEFIKLARLSKNLKKAD